MVHYGIDGATFNRVGVTYVFQRDRKSNGEITGLQKLPVNYGVARARGYGRVPVSVSIVPGQKRSFDSTPGVDATACLRPYTRDPL